MEQPKPKGVLPPPVESAMRRIGDDLRTWRKLRRLTAAQVADRAGVGRDTVGRLEAGRDISTANLLRIARALGVLDAIAGAVDPYETDVGRLRADEALPERVRARKSPR
jgi:transcriptional regulator with XRE-family HTH domain